MVFDEKYDELQNYSLRLPYATNNISYIARSTDPGAVVTITGDEVHITTSYPKDIMSALRGSLTSQIQAKYVNGTLIVSESFRVNSD